MSDDQEPLTATVKVESLDTGKAYLVFLTDKDFVGPPLPPIVSGESDLPFRVVARPVVKETAEERNTRFLNAIAEFLLKQMPSGKSRLDEWTDDETNHVGEG